MQVTATVRDSQGNVTTQGFTVPVSESSSWPPPDADVFITSAATAQAQIDGAAVGSLVAIAGGLVISGASLTPKSGVRILGKPGEPFILDGQNKPLQALKGTGSDVELGRFVVRRYGNLVTESYHDVQSNSLVPARPVFCRDMDNAYLHDGVVENSDSGIQVGNGFRGERLRTSWCKHRGWYGNGAGNVTLTDIQVDHCNVSPVDGHQYFWRHYDAVCKFIGMSGATVTGWTALDNGSAGLWWDSGSGGVVVRNLVALRNAMNGVRWEINSGSFTLDGFECRDNAENFAIANSSGTVSNPLVVKNGVVSGKHPQHSANSRARLVANGNRTPKLNYVRVENVVFDESAANAIFKLDVTNGHPTPQGITLVNVTNAAGGPVVLS